MSRIIVFLFILALLLGCSQPNDPIAEGESELVDEALSTYSNEDLNASFSYPASWTVEENKAEKSVVVLSPPDLDRAGNNILIRIPSESFEEYENLNKELLAEGRMSINSHQGFETKLPTKIYGQHGWINQIIEIDGKHISAGNEIEFSEQEKEGLKEILGSLSF